MASHNYFQKKTLIIYRRVKKLLNQDLSQSSESTQHPESAHDRTCMANAKQCGHIVNPY
jgi:hypothetical protein